MGILVVKADFVGKYDLSKSLNDKITAYIDEYEEGYLIDLLGKPLFDIFKADVATTPPLIPATQIYKDIYDPLSIKIHYCVLRSDGMKKMILGFLFCQIVKDNPIKQTTAGGQKPQVEVSAEVGNTYLYARYNDAIRTYQAIQQYILSKPDVYPTFEGVVKKTLSFI